MFLSPVVKMIKPSMTLAISARANAMKANGIDVIPFSAGEPDFDTPKHICDAACEAIRKGFTRYTPSSGIADLKKAICEKFYHDNGLDYSPSQVMVNCGAKHSDFLAIFSMISPGDEVIIPSPFWLSYPEMVTLAGGVPVIVPCKAENGFKITPRQLKDAVTARTRLLILNTPSNPTGMIYSSEELRALGEVIVGSDMYVLSDEIYEKLIYDGKHHTSIGSLSKDIFDRTITINGVSKAYCMTGWRIGYTAGPEELIKAMDAVQSQEVSNPTSVSQKAALAALTGPQDFIGGMVEEYSSRRRYMVDRLNTIEGVRCLVPDGAFYAFPDVSSLYGRSYNGRLIEGSLGFCNYMLDEWKIAIIPGDPFGADTHVRLSYTVPVEVIEKGIDRFEQGVKALK
ncbi:MAG: pyridoxal phosphate-dependent aminotransferase [Candidatus Latescibacterota bacterium]